MNTNRVQHEMEGPNGWRPSPYTNCRTGIGYDLTYRPYELTLETTSAGRKRLRIPTDRRAAGGQIEKVFLQALDDPYLFEEFPNGSGTVIADKTFCRFDYDAEVRARICVRWLPPRLISRYRSLH